MTRLTQTAFRLDDEDFAILDEVKLRMGFAARSDALRFVLRQYAQQHQLACFAPSPKATRRKAPSKRKR